MRTSRNNFNVCLGAENSVLWASPKFVEHLFPVKLSKSSTTLFTK